MRAGLAHYEPVRFSDNIALAFVDGLPHTELLEPLQQRRNALLQIVESARLAPSHPGMVHLVIDHQRIHLKSELVWMDELLERIT